jgi:hypothetical protein
MLDCLVGNSSEVGVKAPWGMVEMTAHLFHHSIFRDWPMVSEQEYQLHP